VIGRVREIGLQEVSRVGRNRKARGSHPRVSTQTWLAAKALPLLNLRTGRALDGSHRVEGGSAPYVSPSQPMKFLSSPTFDLIARPRHVAMMHRHVSTLHNPPMSTVAAH
jgi:hypothetical protein